MNAEDETPHVGSTLHVDSPWGHEGAFVGPDLVIHADKLAGVIHATDFARFTGSYPWRVTFVPRSWIEAQMIVDRAWASVGTRYSFFGINGWNCEQGAAFAQRGEPVSHSLETVAKIGVVLGALWWLGGDS
jgi:hypothetical protein